MNLVDDFVIEKVMFEDVVNFVNGKNIVLKVIIICNV